VEEVGGEVADTRVKGRRLGFSGEDGPGHGIEPPLGGTGGLGGRIDGQAPGAGIEVDAGVAESIVIDHREAGAYPRIQPCEGMDRGSVGHEVFSLGRSLYSKRHLNST
jgi:hypothetical protein